MTYSLKNLENFDIATTEQQTFDTSLINELQNLADKQIAAKRSLILNLNSFTELSDLSLEFIGRLHENFYNHDCSFVICELNNSLKNSLESSYPHVALAPTQIEAIDIVSMEVIERELLNGEDF